MIDIYFVFYVITRSQYLRGVLFKTHNNSFRNLQN